MLPRLILALLFATPWLTAPAWAQQPKPLDDLTAFFIYHKLTGEPVDFDDLASRTVKVRQAGQFDKAKVQAAEAAALRAKFEAADPEAVYAIALQTRLTYQMNNRGFVVELFEPGRVLILDPFNARAAHPMITDQTTQFRFHLNFLNASSARFIPLPPERARVIDSVARGGNTGAIVELTLRFADSDPKQKLARAAARSGHNS